MNQINTLNIGDIVFVITKERQIKEGRFFGDAGTNDGAIWVVWPEDWDTTDREESCFCRQDFQWRVSHEEAKALVKRYLMIEKQELVSRIEAIDNALNSM